VELQDALSQRERQRNEGGNLETGKVGDLLKGLFRRTLKTLWLDVARPNYSVAKNTTLGKFWRALEWKMLV
jgi:hypothetical protein